MRKAMTATLAAFAVAAPAGTAWGYAHAGAARAKPARPKAKVTKARPKKGAVAAAKTVTYTGPSVDMQWGPVRVQIVVRGTRILDVKATYPTERQRSAFINEQAVPLLREQVLKQQGINNVYSISGATMTSMAYGQSLQAALDRAHIKH